MAGPLLLSENFFSIAAFPGHAISADEEASGHEAFRVADGRRSETDYWTPTTTNAIHRILATCDRIRAGNCAFLDRGHNLAGFALSYEYTLDGSTWYAAATPTIPAATSPGPLLNPNGVVMEDGSWGMLFASAPTGSAWRLSIPAMGTGRVPIVVGAWLGLAFSPGNNFLYPWDEDATDMVLKETISEYAWRGRGPIGLPRLGEMNMKLLTDDEYDLARYHVRGHFGAGRPTWLCYDRDQGDRSVLALRPGGRLNLGLEPGWFPRQGQIAWVEHEPRRI